MGFCFSCQYIFFTTPVPSVEVFANNVMYNSKLCVQMSLVHAINALMSTTDWLELNNQFRLSPFFTLPNSLNQPLFSWLAQRNFWAISWLWKASLLVLRTISHLCAYFPAAPIIIQLLIWLPCGFLPIFCAYVCMQEAGVILQFKWTCNNL